MERNEVIKQVLNKLELQKIRYCVLRNYEFLLEDREVQDVSEHSVDIVIARQDAHHFEQAMKSLGFQERKQGFSLVHRAFFRVYPFGVVSFDVQIGGVHWNDILYLDDEFILGNRVRKGYFFVPAPEDMFTMLLLHSILGKRHFKPKYRAILSLLAKTVSREAVLERVRKVFSPAASEELVTLAFHAEFEKLLNRKYWYIFYFVFQSPVTIWKFKILSLRWAWSRRPRVSPLIAIIGPDGAGKSTKVLALQRFLEKQGKKAVIVYTGRGRGQILPFGTLGRKYKMTEKKRDEVRQVQLGRRRLLYTLAAPVFALDLWLRYWINIFPLRMRGKIVITDRYCTDLFLMQHVPLWLKRILLFFFVLPSRTFYLYNTAEVLHARREEEPVAELERQLGLFEKLRRILQYDAILTENKEKTQEIVNREVMEMVCREWY